MNVELFQQTRRAELLQAFKLERVTLVQTIRMGSGAGCKKYARAYQKHVLHGQETVSIFIANLGLHAIFNAIFARKNHGTLLYCGLRQ